MDSLQKKIKYSSDESDLEDFIKKVDNTKLQKPKKAKSYLWKYFSLIPTINRWAHCDICATNKKPPSKCWVSYSSSTSNLLRHIQNEHPKLVERSEVKEPEQRTLINMVEQMPKSRVKFINNEIAKLIARESLSFSFISSDGFVDMMQAIMPGFTPYSRAWVSTTGIPKLFDEEMGKLSAALSVIDSVSLTADLWTSDADQQYLGITAHYINGEWELKSKVLFCKHFTGRTNAIEIAEVMENCMAKFNIRDKVTACVTDNGKNMVNAVKDHLKITSVPCFDHTLELAINDALASDPLKEIFEKARRQVAHFNQSCVLVQKLREAQTTEKPKKLKQEVKTRWCSTFYMLERLLELYGHVYDILSAEPSYVADLFTPEQLVVVKELVRVLKPIAVISKQAEQDEQVTVSLVPLLKFTINQSLCAPNAADHALIRDFKRDLVRFVKLRILVPGFPHVKETYFASRLDLRMKNHLTPFSSDRAVWDKELSDQAKDEHEEEITQRGSILKSTQKQTEQEMYFNMLESVVPRRRVVDDELARFDNELALPISQNPLLWWKLNESKFPALAKLAKKYLATPATSASSERVFSLGGNICSDKRHSLHPKKLEMLVFLKKNVKSKVKTIE